MYLIVVQKMSFGIPKFFNKQKSEESAREVLSFFHKKLLNTGMTGNG